MPWVNPRPFKESRMRKLRLAAFPLAVAVMQAVGTASAHGYFRIKLAVAIPARAA
jgi:hypothetical protein